MQMATNLPIEIWLAVIKYAVTPDWPECSFFPPEDLLSTVRGFAMASKFCNGVVEMVKYESVYSASFHDFMSIAIPHQRVRRLRIVKDVHNSTEFFSRIASYTQLTSLSFCSGDPASTIGHLHGLPFSVNLRRLDYRLSTTFMPWRSMIIDFAKLVELRLGAAEIKIDMYLPRRTFLRANMYSSGEVFALNLVTKLSSLRNLKLLSVHVALDDELVLRDIIHMHTSSLDHLQPSEGYERHYSDCPMCTTVYDHDEVVQNENSATLVLARGVLSLQCVRWTNAWRHSWNDEEGQRGIYIARDGDEICLTRSDGKVWPSSRPYNYP